MTGTLLDDLELRAIWYALARIEAENGRTGDPDGTAQRFARWVVLRGGGRTMNDRWEQFIHDSVHWHVTRHSEDDDPLSTYSIGGALDYAARELDIIADSEHDAHVWYGEAGEFEESWRASERVRAWSGLQQNLANLATQYARPVPERAPLYAGTDSAELLTIAVRDMVRRIYEDGPDRFTLRECSHDDCRPLPFGENPDD